MAEIINLRRARKAKQRAQAGDEAARNRAKFGRPKAGRELEAARETQRLERLDAHRLDQPSASAPEQKPENPADDD